MKRCAVCDYVEGKGSDWLARGYDNRTILWNKDHNEYQCTECSTTIKETKAEQEVNDAIKALEEIYANPIEGFDEVSEVPPSVSLLPF